MDTSFNSAINIRNKVTQLLHMFQLQGCSHNYYKLQGINSKFHEKKLVFSRIPLHVLGHYLQDNIRVDVEKRCN